MHSFFSNNFNQFLVEKMVHHHLRLAILHTECQLNQCQKLSTFAKHSIKLSFASIPNKMQRRTIVDKFMLPSTLPYNYPEPWPYKEKGFPRYMIIPAQSANRHHKNSKLIVVEGNIGSGKSEFAAQLADELGFLYMPSFSMKDILIDRYGNDMRKFHDKFPKRFRIPDELMFYKNPFDDQTAVMQDLIYQCRWEQYCNALAHIFNTGQGIVLERSAHSDFVFANAMREKNWISMEYFKYYHFVRKVSLPFLKLWPHLVIYLDCPISKCLENIKKRGNQDEIAEVDEKYLKTIEESYKDLLREFKRHSHILTYDWATPEYMDIVLEDIFKLDFDIHDSHTGEVLEEWFTIGDMDTNHGWYRYMFTEKRSLMLKAFGELSRLHYEIAELYIYPPDAEHLRHVMMFEVLKSLYVYGYTEKDSITREGLTQWNDLQLTPERWFEYFWRENWYSALRPPSWQYDPTGKNYDPDYLLNHH